MAHKGNIPWNKGLKMSLEQIEKLRIAHTGYKASPETRKKMSLARKGRVSPTKGEKHTLETRIKMSISQKLAKPKQIHYCEDCNIQISHNAKTGRCLRCAGLFRRKEVTDIRLRDYMERRRFRYMIQKQIFERDNYTCQMCGTTGGDLQVDHIQSWAEYVELRFSMDNCRTLCASCHYEITYNRPMPKEIKGWGHHLFKKEGLE